MGLVDRNGRAEREVLERILALLLALAGLAERAAGLPAPVRLRVLEILGYGEAEARSFVTAMAFGAPASVDTAASPAAGDAGRHAASFRALALVLGAMLAQASRRAQSLPREAGLQAAPPAPPRDPARPNRRRPRAPPAAGPRPSRLRSS